ncbi:unnamed protein product, partial [Ectocarpus sp. 12 AP-2014]
MPYCNFNQGHPTLPAYTFLHQSNLRSLLRENSGRNSVIDEARTGDTHRNLVRLDRGWDLGTHETALLQGLSIGISLVDANVGPSEGLLLRWGRAKWNIVCRPLRLHPGPRSLH